MSEPAEAQGGGRLCLVTPDRMAPADLGAVAARILGALADQVVCIRLDLGEAEEAAWTAAANALLGPCHEAEVPLLIAEHYRLVEPLGLDGVHLGRARVPLRRVREALGPDRVIGAFAGDTRHQGMVLAEAGADYVALGPLHADSGLGAGEIAPDELFLWWAEMIETPVLAEGGVTPADVARLRGAADFFTCARGVWTAPDPVFAVAEYAAALAD